MKGDDFMMPTFTLVAGYDTEVFFPILFPIDKQIYYLQVGPIKFQTVQREVLAKYNHALSEVSFRILPDQYQYWLNKSSFKPITWDELRNGNKVELPSLRFGKF